MRTLLHGGRVFDGTGSLPAAADVLICDGTIAEVGRAPAPPVDRSLDVRGCTVMPGLINLHEHQAYAELIGPWEEIIHASDSTFLLRAVKRARRSLHRGITTVRDLGAPHGVNLIMQHACETGLAFGPRVVAAGCPVAISGGHAYEMCVEADGAEAFVASVRGQIRAGATWIKLMVTGGLTRGATLERFFALQPSDDELSAAIKAAHVRSIPVTGHINGPHAIRACVDAGIDCIEHGVGLTEELAQDLAFRQIAFVPTLSTYIRSAEKAHEWGRPPDQVSLAREIVSRHRHGVRLAIARGVRIGLGTDSIGDLAEEARELNSLGCPAPAVLRAATLGAAEILRQDEWLGSIHVGKAADLLVVDGDPTVDLDALGRVHTVVASGQIVSTRCTGLQNLGQ